MSQNTQIVVHLLHIKMKFWMFCLSIKKITKRTKQMVMLLVQQINKQMVKTVLVLNSKLRNLFHSCSYSVTSIAFRFGDIWRSEQIYWPKLKHSTKNLKISTNILIGFLVEKIRMRRIYWLIWLCLRQILWLMSFRIFVCSITFFRRTIRSC